MSGCFDGAVGDAEAEEGTSETTQEATPTVNRIITIQVEPDETVNITLNGTALEFVSGWNCPEARTYCSMSEYVGFVITCDDPTFPNGMRFDWNRYGTMSPNQAGVECTLTTDNPTIEDYPQTKIFSFVEHPLA